MCRGEGFRALLDRQLALDEWEHMLQLDPTSAVALDWMAKARIEAGQYTAAIDLLRTANRDQTQRWTC